MVDLFELKFIMVRLSFQLFDDMRISSTLHLLIRVRAFGAFVLEIIR